MNANDVIKAAQDARKGVEDALISRNYKAWIKQNNPQMAQELGLDDEWSEWNEPVMPDSYIEDGERKAVIYGGDLAPESLTLIKDQGHWYVHEVIF